MSDATPISAIGSREVSSRAAPSRLRAYGLAIVVTTIAVLIRWALNPILGDSVPWITLFPAIAFVAFHLSIGPSILSVALGLIAVDRFIAPISGPLAIPRQNAALSIVFLAGCGLLIVFGESRQRNLRKLHTSESELKRVREELEQKVEERTRQLSASLALLESGIKVRDGMQSAAQELTERIDGHGEGNDSWLALCERAAVEQDPAKLLALARQINGALEDRQSRLRQSTVTNT
jgi:hypothetical protein